jgi:amino acid adenylation domain-containing protein/non-ribosomal peptide synthase protein (TIGR01720 family)
MAQCFTCKAEPRRTDGAGRRLVNIMDSISYNFSSHGTTFVEVLRWNVQHHPDKRAYTFLLDGETREEHRTYAELDKQARHVAGLLQESVAPGDRVLLLYPPGLEYIDALFGCWYAGVIAVPAYPPRPNHNLNRIEAILQDADAHTALTTRTILTGLHRKFQADSLMPQMRWILPEQEESRNEHWREYHPTGEMLALLQYTSGSTGKPKGVMVSHDNLVQNAWIAQRHMELEEGLIATSWLPAYHDMGLMGLILEPFYLGGTSILMAPASFLQQPLRWLQAISRYRANLSGGPNFAFDLCARKATEEVVAALDLSCWNVAFTGAEPIRAETLKRFYQTFAPCGLREEALYPCYGMAEATLILSGGARHEAPIIRRFTQESLELGKPVLADEHDKSSHLLVSCGRSLPDQRFVIVDPVEHVPCPPYQVGEIWVASPNVASGYWGLPQQTQETFQARLPQSHEGPFLRTGDLGFIGESELFVTGRLKDIIILRGRNIYPQDVEVVVSNCHPALRPGNCAAFSIAREATEGLVIVQEVDRHYQKWNIQEVIQTIHQALARELDIEAAAIVLVRAGGVFKTTSGKIQRLACRQAFLDGSLPVVHQWSVEEIAVSQSLVDSPPQQLRQVNVSRGRAYRKEEIAAWLRAHIAERTHLSVHMIYTDMPFISFGLSSIDAIGLSGELENWLGVSFSPTLIYDYPSIDALAKYIETYIGSTEVSYKESSTDQAPADLDGIAIIGLGCRFPGAENPRAFWQLLTSGGDAISEVPAARWNSQELYAPEAGVPNKMNTRWGGFLERVDTFDARFFGISAREAEQLDPQQRLLLEVAWETFEQAGINPKRMAGSATGVFVGISSYDYVLQQAKYAQTIDAYLGTGNAHSVAANRLSYVFDLRGPSIAVDTACSSSLVAVHQACQSLRAGECTLALAGGVNVLLSSETTIAFSQAHMMAADGRCKTFDASANGYVRSEGCGLVLLKPLKQALKDGDTVLAVVRGSAINQDGASNGLTAPNGPAQEAVIRQALATAHVKPADISYVETHGTGTALGDPIEVKALKAVLMQDRAVDQPCLLGAVKSNIGHLEAAAGIAGLIKTVLCLLHHEIPPNLHFKQLNPYIDLSATPFSLPTEKRQWISSSLRIAGVSAFGFGGTNAHVIIEEAPRLDRSDHTTLPERSRHILTLSARSEAALRQLGNRYQQYLTEHADVSMADLCYTAATGRAHFPYRTALVAQTSQELLEKLSDFPIGNVSSSSDSNPKIVLLFSGQGSSYAGMVRRLYTEQPVFRQEIDRCEQILSAYLEYPLNTLLFSDEGQILARSQETHNAQPILFAIEYALSVLWSSWGVRPDMVVGHSMGEYVAACVSGMMSLEEGLKFIATRGRLMQELPENGAMVTVFADLEQLRQIFALWPHEVAVAAINGPHHIVLSGPRERLKQIVSQLEACGIDTRFLPISRALHSEVLVPMQDDFTQYARSLALHAEHIPLITNLTGKLLPTGEVLPPDYWWEQTRNTVQFLAGIQTAYEQGGRIFIEVGPSDTLTRMGIRCLPDVSDVAWFSSLKQGRDDWEVLLECVAALYMRGYDIDWTAFERPYTLNRTRLSLPLYPFERQHYWFAEVVPERTSSLNRSGSISYQEKDRDKIKRQYKEEVGSMDIFQAKSMDGVASSHSSTGQPRKERIVAELRSVLGKLLHCSPEDIARTMPFLEMGADSFVLIDAVRTIEQKFGVKLPVRQLYGELGTLDALAAHLDQHLPPDVPTATPALATPYSDLLPIVDAAPSAIRERSVTAPSKQASAELVERVIARQLDKLSDIMALQLEAARNTTETRLSAPPGATSASVPASATKSEEHEEKDVVSRPERYVPYQPLKPLTREDLTERQQQHMQALIERLTRRTQASKQYTQTYRPVLADNRTTIGFRFSIKELLYLIVAQRSQGAYIWDLDGNRFLDVSMGFGVNLFGHNPPFIQEALAQQLAEGFQLGAQSLLAGEVARLICDLTGMERVFFCNSGTEAVMAAVRIARAVSGKSKIVIFRGAYHGTFDGVLARAPLQSGAHAIPMAPGVPQKMAEDVLVLDYGDDQSLAIIQEHASELAAVLVEPVQSRHPDVQPRAFLQRLRALTTEANIALIFDETITGFRILPGGAQEWFGVKADIATYGKIVGGGMPIGVVTGKALYMDSIDGGMWQYGDMSYPQAEVTIFGGTFSKHPLALAAARAVLLKLKQEGAALQERLNERTARMVAALNAFFTAEHVPIRCIHFGSLFRFSFTQNMDLFFYHLLDKGVYIWEGRNCLLSTAHSDEDIAFLIQCVKDSIREMREGGFLPPSPLSPPPDGPSSSGFYPDANRPEITKPQETLRQEPEASSLPQAKGVAPGTPSPLVTFPLTDAQQQLWLACNLSDKEANAYVERALLRLNGKLNYQVLRTSVQKCLERHEALRTVFAEQGDYQQVLPVQLMEIEIPLVDCSGDNDAEKALHIEQWLQEDAEQGFDLVRGPLLRIRLLKESSDHHLLLLAIHHLIADGWSISLVLQDVAQCYTTSLQPDTDQLQPALQYREYVRWQEQLPQLESFYVDEAYWSTIMRDAPPPALEVLFDRPRPTVKTFAGASERIVLSEEVYSTLSTLGQSNAATPYTVLLTIYLLWLHRLTGQHDIVVGIPTLGRPMDGGETLIGHCANVLPLRSTLKGSPTFSEYLQWVKQRLLALQEHGDTPFSMLERVWLRQQASFQPAPLSTTFNLDRIASSARFGDVYAEVLPLQSTYAAFDLSVNVTSVEEKLYIDINYNTDLFDTETVQHLGASLSTLLRSVAAYSEQSIWDLSLLSSAEQAHIIYDWNQTQALYPAEQCIHRLFEEQASYTPDAIAVVYEDEQISYAQLNARANQLARALQSLGVGLEVRVGLCLERSLELIISMLAILKVGGTYVPLDVSYPQERLAFMLTDAQISVLLIQQAWRDAFPTYHGSLLCLDTDWSRFVVTQPTANVLSMSSAENLAYLMYTSGSTGQPKGVSVPHRGVVRLVKETNYAELTATEIVPQFASISFDAATFEIWGSLLNGARLVLLPTQTPSLEELGSLLQQYAITTLWLTAGLFNQMVAQQVEALSGVRQLLAGGDVLSVPHARRTLEKLAHCKLINGYGPTENTTFTTCYPMTEPDQVGPSVPIGRPIANTQVYVLDDHFSCVPVGVPGELYIGGAGLARGYHNCPDLTAERFLPHPFSSRPGERLYKTGDLVRYRADGNLEFLGRNDQQIKLRGFRIELGEIEIVLTMHPGVRDCVVLAREDSHGNKRLVAYIIPTSSEAGPTASEENIALTSNILRLYLQEHLPSYMVPSAFVFLDVFPLTANGKLDRRALPSPDRASFGAQEQVLAPRTPIEEVLVKVWAQVLGLESVGVEDNFFELGGHSLLATQIISRIRQHLHVELPLRSLFERPSVAALAPLIDQEAVQVAPPFVPASRAQALPLSFAQERLWFLQQLEPENISYHMPTAVRLSGEFSIACFEWSLNQIVARHEILRTTFHEREGQPTQEIAAAFLLPLPLIDLRGLPGSAHAPLFASLKQQFITRHFDLSEGPILRVSLIRLTEQEHLLLFMVHHIAADGWSVHLFYRELTALYQLALQPSSATPLPSLSIQYADYALWQRSWLEGETLEQHLTYWRQQLAGAPALLELPTDRPRLAVQTFTGAQQTLLLPPDLLQGLTTLSQREGVTLFMTLLAAFQVLLMRYSGQEDIVVGSPIANRQYKELEGLIGMFVNTLVLRTDLSGHPSFRQVLARVREVALGAYAHQDLPFERLVEDLQPERSLSYSPIFQVLFVLQNAPALEVNLPKLTWQPLQVEQPGTKFDLTLQVEESEQGLWTTIEYSTDLFDASTIERMLGHWQTLLQSCVAMPQQAVTDLTILTPTEQASLLDGQQPQWNEEVSGMTLPQLVEQQVEATPEAIALVFAEQHLTYQELNVRANRLAYTLQQRGVEPGILVGVSMERSVDLVVALLAILKAGGAYVPLDPATPLDRLAFLIEDSQIALLVTTPAIHQRISEQISQVPYLYANEHHLQQGGETNPAPALTPRHLAYLIYTSGSTGRPKGVAIEHHSPVTFINWALKVFTAEELSGVLASTSITFDLSIFELFVPLSCGGTVILVENALAQPAGWAWERVTLINTVPSVAMELERARSIPATVRTINLAGEPLQGKLVQRLYQQASIRRVLNLYGPSEATTYATYAVVAAEEATPSIGRPIEQTQVYILDAHHHLVPPGIVGELYLGGAGLARGYYGRAELTAERFVPHPFSTVPGARLYRTGDLVRYRADGMLEYQGRVDFQIKLRGFRIELGEIEACLRQQPGVQEAVVVLQKAAGEATEEHAFLVVYLVPQVGATIQTSEIEAGLSRHLPDYMVPHAFVQLDSLPLTPNGKLDRRALPLFQLGSQPHEMQLLPRTPKEQTLFQIWQAVLGVEQFGINDNFFALGGDSIISLQVVARARQAGLHFFPKQLFQYQTIAQLAAVISDPSDRDIVASESVDGPAPLTPIQQWFFARHLVQSHHFNQSVFLQISPRWPIDLLLRALALVVQQHEALRLRFVQTSDGWVQQVQPLADVVEWSIAQVDLRRIPPQEQQQVLMLLGQQTQASLDLQRGPMFRAVAMVLNDQDAYRLLLVIHHLVVDGVSWRVLLEDLHLAMQSLLQDRPVLLPPATAPFTRWARYLQQQATADWLQAEIPYWLQAAQVVTKPLPLDGPFGSQSAQFLQPEATTRSVETILDEHETHLLLREAVRPYHSQIQEVLLTAILHTLSQWIQSQQIRLDLEGHGREEVGEQELDLTRTVGWFTSLFPVLFTLPPQEADWQDWMIQIKEQVRAIPHKGLGYGLLRYLHPDTGVTEILQAAQPVPISFNYLGQFDQVFQAHRQPGETHDGSEYEQVQLAPEASGATTGPLNMRSHQLSIDGILVGGQLHLTWNYSTQHFQEDTVNQLARQLQRDLQALLKHCLFPEAGRYTPADFPLAQLDQATLDQVLADHQGEVEDLYPLTSLQQGLLFHTLSDPHSGVYMEQFWWVMNQLDVPRFTLAWQTIIAQHPILRTSFVWQGLAQPLQQVWPQVSLPLLLDDWSAATPERQQQMLDEYLQADRQRGVHLQQAPLLRLALIKLSANRTRVIWTYHHLLLDGWSMAMLIQEVLSTYHQLTLGEPLMLEQRRPYREYVAWLQEQNQHQAETYWQQYLAGVRASTPLGIDQHPSQASTALSEPPSASEQLTLPIETSQQWRTRIRQQGLTLNTLLQGAWALVLSCYSGQEEVLFGNTVTVRPPQMPGIERMLGLFINAVPVRISKQAEWTVRAWLQAIQEQQVEQQAYTATPLTTIKSYSEIPGAMPLFESLLVVENYPVEAELREVTDRLRIEDLQIREQTSYPLTIDVESDVELRLRVGYDEARLSSVKVQRLLCHLQRVLAQLIEHPERLVRDITLLTEAERTLLLETWNATAPEEPALEQCMHQLFEAQVEQTPAEIAVICQGEQLSYQELNWQANQVARHLRKCGVGSETLVAILADRSIAFVVAVLAIFKAGGAYLPLDPHHPQARQRQVLEQSHCQFVLHTPAFSDMLAHTLATFPGESRPLAIALDGSYTSLQTENLPAISRIENLAYVIYTSGSTGVPKGAMVEQRGMLNHLYAKIEALSLSASDIVAQTASQCFDISVWQFLAPLLIGGRVQIYSDEIAHDAQQLLEQVERQQVSILETVPSLLQAMLDAQENSPHDQLIQLKALRWLIPTGEALPVELCRRWFQRYPYVPLLNAYGPTECSDDVTHYVISQPPADEQSNVPIGRPIRNIQLYVLDQYLQPVPIGIIGELYVGGIGVGRGYLGDEQRTREAFVSNPFTIGAGERLYKTGDLVRYLPDGNLEFIGRRDSQIKLRGFRIEPGEIEARLRKYPVVRDAIVLLREDVPGDQRLVAYVVVTNGDAFVESEVRHYLRETLPEYMVPTSFVALTKWPLTANGKVDRRALPLPAQRVSGASELITAGRTPIEEIVLDIYRQVLDREHVGIDESFFDLGGHSLLATQVISRLRHLTQTEVPLRWLFETPSVAGLAQRIEQTLRHGSSEILPPLVPASRAQPLPLSFAQERLWFLQQLQPEDTSYHTPAAFKLSGPFSVEIFDRSFQALVQRHESLRTTFAMPFDQPVQIVHADLRIEMPIIDLQKLDENMKSQAAFQLMREAMSLPFDMSSGPLLRLGLFSIREEEYIFYVVMHHIIFDAWSVTVFLRELLLMYRSLLQQEPFSLAPLSLHYADFAVWQRNWLQGAVLDSLVDYWTEQLMGARALELPTDRPRMNATSNNGALYTFKLSAQLVQGLRELSRQQGTTLFMTLLAAFQILLYHYTGEQDIVVGTDIANRTAVETEEMIGFFVNLLVLRLRSGIQETFQETLKSVRSTVLDAYAHQHLPFEKLIEVLQLAGKAKGVPLVNVLFVLQNVPSQAFELPGLSVSPIEIEINSAKFDIALFLAEDGEELQGSVNYRTDLFNTERIVRLIHHFEVLLQDCVAHPDKSVEALQIHTEEEKEQQLQQDESYMQSQRRKLKAARRQAFTSSTEN